MVNGGQLALQNIGIFSNYGVMDENTRLFESGVNYVYYGGILYFFTHDRILLICILIADDDMITTLFPVDPDPDLEVEEQTSQTWHIKDWKKLEKKVYWPTFECGGSTWYVLNITPRPKLPPFL